MEGENLEQLESSFSTNPCLSIAKLHILTEYILFHRAHLNPLCHCRFGRYYLGLLFIDEEIEAHRICYLPEVKGRDCIQILKQYYLLAFTIVLYVRNFS